MKHGCTTYQLCDSVRVTKTPSLGLLIYKMRTVICLPRRIVLEGGSKRKWGQHSVNSRHFQMRGGRQGFPSQAMSPLTGEITVCRSAVQGLCAFLPLGPGPDLWGEAGPEGISEVLLKVGPL